ncbi:MAG: hypothetical protein AAGC72_02270 [Planctomycetota bacterium]
MMHRLTKQTLATLLAAMIITPAVLAEDEGLSVEERREQARIERLWNLNWRTFAPYFVEYKDVFICVPTYDRSKPSSFGKSISEYRSETAWQQEFKDERGKEQKRKLTKPEEDAFAAVALIPDVEVGQYGYIRSGMVEKIIDDKTVELEDIWLVDADAVRDEKKEMKEALWGQVLEDIEDAIRDRDRHRRSRTSRRMAENDALDWGFEAREEAASRQRDGVFSRYTWVVKGFSTRNLKEEARWPSANAKGGGLQLIIVDVSDRTVTAMPAASLRKGITELQFIDYLQSRQMKKAEFVEAVTEAKREHRSDYVKHVLATLTGEASPASKEAINNEIELAD